MHKVYVTDDPASLSRQFKSLRCSECKTDNTLALTLGLDAAIEEAKITGQTATRALVCPVCGTRGTFDVTPPEAQKGG